ncbi:MAG: alanine racemase [Burkholderiaceae bacterium]
MPRPISAVVSLESLSHNLAVVSQSLNCVCTVAHPVVPRIWAVIKANAYGHGITNALRGFARADGLAMLDLNEAVRCRDAGWNKPILLLEGFFEPSDIAVADQYRLSLVVHCQDQLDMLDSARFDHPIDAFIKLNSGMNRLGFSEANYQTAYRQALAAQQRGILGALGKMTHLACADDNLAITTRQIQLFNDTTSHLPGKISVCNSAAALTPGLWTQVSGQGEQWVRPGICLYGASPFADKTASDLGLLPAMTFSARLIGVQTLAKGAGVGYGHTFIAPCAMRVGVVACGYADGYPRHASTGTPITVDGVLTRVLGRVSMDMLAVDLTPVPGAHVGTTVIMWGRGGPSVDDVARASGTIGYELLCAVAPRVPKTVVMM